jgi:hypothetical protein
MDLAHPVTLLLPAGLALLVGWRLYSRLKRILGRQRLSTVRPWLAVCLFPLLIALVLSRLMAEPKVALALVAGVAAGAALGFHGLRLTKFEQTPQGLFYTPNVHLGIALSLLLIGRIGYRAAQLYLTAGAAYGNSFTVVRSPLTMLVFGTLAGYYVAYAVGLLRWRRRANAERPPALSEGSRD